MNNQKFFNSICQKMHKNKYKITSQRSLIVETLLNVNSKHLSAEEIYELVRKENSDIGLATVYRTLDMLVELDILQQMNFGDGKVRYEFNDQDVHHHHHLICLNCGEVLEFGIDLLDVLERQVKEKTGFEIVDHKLKFYGYCRDCQE